MDNWTPCSKGLPNKRKPVLVTGIYGVIFIAIRKYDPIERKYVWWHPEYGMVKVIAWMPLPEPWKGEEDGGSD